MNAGCEGIRPGEENAAGIHRPGAFTLLEVLIALTIFALTAIVLGAAYINVLNAYEFAARSNQTDEDVRFARAQLLAEPDHDKAEQGGDFESVGGRRVKWQAAIESTATVDLFTVTFTCETTDPVRSEPQTVKETFMLLRPTWSDPVERGKLQQATLDRINTLQGKTK